MNFKTCIITSSLYIIGLILLHPISGFAIEKYSDFITTIPSSTPINWSEISCDEENLKLFPTQKKVVMKCISQENSIYLLDAKHNILRVTDFIPTHTIDLGGRLGLIFYSDTNAEYLLLGFDESGNFKDEYILDNEPILDKTKTKLAYPKLLVWYSYIPNKGDDCTRDIFTSAHKKLSDFSQLYKYVPIQIQIISMQLNKKNVFNEHDRKQVIVTELIQKTISNITFRLKSDVEEKLEFKKNLFVFLLLNSPNKINLKNSLNKYKPYLNQVDLELFFQTKSCQ